MTQATTPKHMPRGRPQPLQSAGLHTIAHVNTSAHGKPLLSPLPSQAELTARRKSERLEAATQSTPIRNSTVRTGGAYKCPELNRNAGLQGARFAAYALPSRVGNRLHYPDGRVEVIES